MPIGWERPGCSLSGRSASVSYTHLDVYKRQAGKLAPLGFGFMRLPLKDADDPTSIDIDKCCELVDILSLIHI